MPDRLLYGTEREWIKVASLSNARLSVRGEKENLIKWGKRCMWVITVYSKGNTKMFEFDTEREAREALKEIPGCKILSQVVYFNDPGLVLTAI